jgi:hypothetical protein
MFLVGPMVPSKEIPGGRREEMNQSKRMTIMQRVLGVRH